MNENSGSGYVFISHSSKDDEFVNDLRINLEALNIKVWADSRELSSGKLSPEIMKAITGSRHFIVVVSQHSIGSKWVRKEVREALKLEEEREDYKIIPVLISGMDESSLGWMFGDEEDDEPLAVIVRNEPSGLIEAIPEILVKLGEFPPGDIKGFEKSKPKPIEELVLEMEDPKLEFVEGKRHVKAKARLKYHTSRPNCQDSESRKFNFAAPIGPIEAEELKWYLESYYIWPVGVFEERAKRVEAQLPKWGHSLYDAAVGVPAANQVLSDWRESHEESEPRFSILVDRELIDDANEQEKAVANEAASVILSLPWELMHDEKDYLFKREPSIRVRRRMPHRKARSADGASFPIRILLVSPRPDDAKAGYIDHRVSARPLVDALEGLGDLVSLTVLSPPTFPALKAVLKEAREGSLWFDVVHFDGHGVYDTTRGLHGLGGLCFEHPDDTQKLIKRRSDLVYAGELAELMKEYRVPLVFLEACQTAKTEEDPTASVAGKLLEAGVTSVVAMSHSVLVETARRFVGEFYGELAKGKQVGNAMLAGQKALIDDTYRIDIMGAGKLHLQDWFVPVLYQEEQDPQLFSELPSEAIKRVQGMKRDVSFGKLPKEPLHSFIGRSRELLALERLLHDKQYAVVRGQGGSGKTALVVELARWLVRTGRHKRAAFVSMETYQDTRSVLDSIGHQLLPEGEGYSVATYSNLKEARQPVERALQDHPTIIVIDNMESVLPDATGQTPPEAAPIGELFELCQALLNADPATRLIFTSREPLPEPFANRQYERVLGALSRDDAIELVSSVMAQNDLTPEPTDPGKTPEEIIDLVEAVNRHARALVLLVQEISQRGVKATTESLHNLMAELHKRYEDDQEKDRETSLYASMELSLRRLPAEMQEQIKPLAVFHGGFNIAILGIILKAEPDKLPEIAESLVDVGLAEDMGRGHYRLDPALPPYLLGQMDEGEQEGMRERWAEGMTALTGFLFKQQFQDARLAAHLTLLELPNFLALLDWTQDNMTPDEVVSLASNMETLLEYLGRPRALAQVVNIRQKSSESLGEWSHARYLAESRNIDRLLESGNLQAAYTAAQQLLQNCISAGENAYPDANYDIAMAHSSLGRVLSMGGSAETALQYLEKAQRRFQRLADAGNTSAARMASVSITGRADCLSDLGRLDEAADAYEEAISRKEKLNDTRGVAVNKGQLGTVRRMQGRYDEALDIYAEALGIFESLGEPGSVAVAWHQIAIVYKEAGQYEQAEQAYRQSLAIEVQRKNRSGEASSLDELGGLYNAMGRLEEAVTFHQQAADIRFKLGDLAAEGISRSNMANALIRLRRHNEARLEIHRAIECRKPYGHAAELWKTFAVLHDLEKATGDTETAAQAREQAIQSYLAYRRAGGVSQTSAGQWCSATAQAIQQGAAAQAKQGLIQLSGQVTDPEDSIIITKLQAILDGNREPSLAEDPELYYRDAVELQLLLENLK